MTPDIQRSSINAPVVCEAEVNAAELPDSVESNSNLEVAGLAVCKIVSFQDGYPVLLFQLRDEVLMQLAIAASCDLAALSVGDYVCACFDRNQCDRPVVLGKFCCDVSRQISPSNGMEICDDKQIMLRCGKASISLKADGTVAIRGTYVASRATHTNRIRGGNVQIN